MTRTVGRPTIPNIVGVCILGAAIASCSSSLHVDAFGITSTPLRTVHHGVVSSSRCSPLSPCWTTTQHTRRHHHNLAPLKMGGRREISTRQGNDMNIRRLVPSILLMLQRMIRTARRSTAVMKLTLAMVFGITSGKIASMPHEQLHMAAPTTAATTVVLSTRGGATMSGVVRKVIGTRELDDMVQAYVEQHMFDDDVYNPVESAYREAYQDVATSNYPKALSATASHVLGETITMTSEVEAELAPPSTGNAILATYTKSSALLTKLFGLSKSTADLAVVGLFLASMPFLGLLALTYGNLSRRKINRDQVKNYGSVQ
eukprot:scaffold40779_cov57-Attheya_sp.AAC.6